MSNSEFYPKSLDEKEDLKNEMSYFFENYWGSFKDKVGIDVENIQNSISSSMSELNDLQSEFKHSTSDLKNTLDDFSREKKEIKQDIAEVKEISEIISSIDSKEVTVVTADMKALIVEVAKLLKKDTEEGLRAIREDVSKKFREVFVTSKMVSLQLELANKGLRGILASCKEGNTNIATSEVLMYNLMETIRFVEGLSENQKTKLLGLNKTQVETNLKKYEESVKNNYNNLAITEQKIKTMTQNTLALKQELDTFTLNADKRIEIIDKKTDRMEKSLEDFKTDINTKFEAISRMLQEGNQKDSNTSVKENLKTKE